MTSEDAEAHRTRPTNAELKDIPSAETRRNVKPMLAKLAEEPFDGPDWLFEVKWDGYRAIAEVSKQDVSLYSRNQRSLNNQFPTIVNSLKRIGRNVVLDGEIVVVDETGKPDFQLLQNFEREGRGNLVYYVFDILYLDGHDLRRMPLIGRKEILRQVLPDLRNIRLSDYIEEKGTAFFKVVTQRGMEGIIAKKKQSIYVEGERSRKWLKIKKQMQQEAVIAGFTEPRGGRKYFGALILGVYEAGELKYIGHTGAGFSDSSLVQLSDKLRPLVQEAPPFRNPPETNAPVHWVRPELVCEVRFSDWTADGIMRHPVFVGLRSDKATTEVRREVPGQLPTVFGAKKSSHRYKLLIGGHMISVTNPEKIYWPADGYTKKDLVDYYRNIAPIILPYLRHRPQNLLRHPEGIEGESFYQKDVDRTVPKWIETVGIRSELEEREITYLVCQDEATLVYLANLGCIELNPWSSRLHHLDYPDYLVLDLDPLDIGFEAVVEAALAIRRVLCLAGARSFCKTSGASGLHVYVPMGARYHYEQIRRFAEIVAHLIHSVLPRSTSLERNPSKRRGKVYLDCLQNRRGQTIVAPYSIRARPGAPVSTPLKWEEVRRGLDPSAYTMKTILERIDKNGDIFRPILDERTNLEECVENLIKATIEGRAS